MGIGPGNEEDVSTPLNPRPATRLTHDYSDGMLQCLGGKQCHVLSVTVVLNVASCTLSHNEM